MTVANVFLLVRLWLGKNFPAAVAAVTLAVSHTFWFHASIIETYTLWSAIFTAELIMLLQYAKTAGWSIYTGLACLTALQLLFITSLRYRFLCYAAFFVVLAIKKNIRFRDFLIIALLWIIGVFAL